MSNIVERDFFCLKSNKYTLFEINIEPENRPLEKEIPIGKYHF